MEKNIEKIIDQLKSFGIFEKTHSSKSLVSHLVGTYKILESWKCEDSLCLAGLCHSVYGTESYTKQSVPLKERELIQKLIGIEAEELSYFFGAHVKKHFWSLLEKEEKFEILDRFTDKIIPVSRKQISQLVTLALANWLEQRPRAEDKYKFIRKDEFISSKRFLPTKAYDDFEVAYNITKGVLLD